MTESEYRTITLTGRAPVRIRTADWPVIARADDFRGGNGIECQASETMLLRVRRHADGRTIVSGVRDRGPGGMPLGYTARRAGLLVAAGADLAAAIADVADSIGCEDLASYCLADLPAEDLT